MDKPILTSKASLAFFGIESHTNSQSMWTVPKRYAGGVTFTLQRWETPIFGCSIQSTPTKTGSVTSKNLRRPWHIVLRRQSRQQYAIIAMMRTLVLGEPLTLLFKVTWNFNYSFMFVFTFQWRAFLSLKERLSQRSAKITEPVMQPLNWKPRGSS